jgi:hypothetical protein
MALPMASGWTPEEKRALGLYAVLSRDAGDFIDMVREDETSNEALQVLHQMLAVPNPDNDADDVKLNSVGDSIVLREMKKRGVKPRPLPVE